MVGIVPIRSGSKGIKDKNVRPINGKPLVQWCLDALSKSSVSKIIVAVDEPYFNIIKELNIPKVEVYLRSPLNSTDISSSEDVLCEVINQLKIDDDIIFVQSTSPLITVSDIENSIELYKEYDSVLSGVRQKRFIWNEDGIALNYNYKNRPRRQDFKGYLVENGALYLNHSSNILKYNNRLSGKIGIYEMDETSYYEIDSEFDWGIVEKLLEQNENRT